MRTCWLGFRRILRLLAGHWEYWPFHWVYGPVYPVFIFYLVRSGFRFFFTAANPTIENGGFVLESKKKVYDLLPAGSYPRTLFYPVGVSPEEVLAGVQLACMQYPLVIKPDIGGRGRAVVIVDSETAFYHYVPLFNIDFLVQEWVDYPHEAGIFFVKMPGDTRGRITGIVGKGFGAVIGNGLHTIEQLILANDRFARQYHYFAKALGLRLHEVPANGEYCLLMPYGNHARGAVFYNWTHKVSPGLTTTLDALVSQIDGYYYGRLDVRYRSWAELENGTAFSIIELNGAGSEPTHMYDPANSIWFAWKEIIRHWAMLYRVSRANHALGVPYMGLRQGLAMLRANSRYEAKLNALHNKLQQHPPPIKPD